MKPRSYTSYGIVLARKNFGEADRILTLYTKNFGRINLIAKGVRRPKSRKRGHVEVFNQIRFQAFGGRGMDIMTEAEIVDDFKEVRGSLKKISLAYYLSEVLARITNEGDANEDLYNLMSNSLEKLKTTKALKNLRLKFITKLLVITGYWPENMILENPDEKLDEIIERQVFSKRVGKSLIT